MNRFITVIFILLSYTAQAQLKQYSFETVDTLPQTKFKVIFIHTEWCGVCQKMKNTTLQDSVVVHLLNQHFYFISFDAEYKNEITFSGHTFKYIPHGTRSGTHQLAKQLATINHKIAYPTICILNNENEIVFQIASALNTTELLSILQPLK